jgi:Spy/CpxP family protein refolding chaperone
VVIFGAGVLTGGFLVGDVQHQHWKNPRRAENFPANAVDSNSNSAASFVTNLPPSRARLPETLSKQLLQRLDVELHLSPDQREAIQKIITDGQNLMRKTMQDARLEIREQLTPEQRAHFDELVKRPARRTPNTNAPAVFPLSSRTNAPGN